MSRIFFIKANSFLTLFYSGATMPPQTFDYKSENKEYNETSTNFHSFNWQSNFKFLVFVIKVAWPTDVHNLKWSQKYKKNNTKFFVLASIRLCLVPDYCPCKKFSCHIYITYICSHQQITESMMSFKLMT